jgi:hypothetical protein
MPVALRDWTDATEPVWQWVTVMIVGVVLLEMG